ncbi:MAG: hypothetical protein ACYC0M_15635 [Burkholderiales bacterium]
MPAYLQNSDPTLYGVPNATSAQINAASALIDSYLGRREGLLWSPDANGNPIYMQGLSAKLTLTLAAAIAPGLNVSVNVTGPTSMLAVGDVLIIDIATTTVTEALVVQSINGQTIIFANVQFNHANGAQLAAGLTITEQKTMPQGRPITQVSRAPIANALSGVGRYGYQRRGDDGFGNMDTYNLLAVMSKFGGPPAWEAFSLQSNSIDPQTGQMWIPAGVLLAYYTEVKINYIAGWSYAGLPYEIKQACANIIMAQTNFPEMNGNIQTLKSGDTTITRFKDTVLDADTKRMIDPFKVRAFV